MQIRKAKRDSAHLLISFTGPSGSGKTKSALRFAEGLGGKIGFIDTESGRAGIYADEHDFDVIELDPPFTPQRYIEAIRKFEDAGYETIIIDSASHEWEGIGGVLEMADGQKSAAGKPLQGLLKWKMPKGEHKRFMSELLRTRMNIVVCLRAKPEYEQRRGPNGKDEIVRVGWKEIAEQNFIYEMTVSAMLSNEPGRQGFPTLTKCPGSLRAAFPENKPISEDSGAAVKAWLGDVKRDEAFEKLLRDASDISENGTAELKAFWDALNADEKLKLKPHMGTLKARAADADDPGHANDDAAQNLENPFSAGAAE